ncbi:MAG: PaaI family thioesterase [Bacteroidales bacterium]|nr:PaaI family thioesterase [Bacteroidales bacterium]
MTHQTKTNPPTLIGEPGWTALDSIEEYSAEPSFVIGDRSSDRFAVKYFVREKDKRLFGKVFFGKGTQGPPGNAHGGSIAAVLDEAMGFSAWVQGHTVVAAKIEIEFFQMLPVNSVVTVEAWVEAVDGRKIRAQGKIYTGETVYSSAEGLFVTIPVEQFGDASHYLHKIKEQMNHR